VTPLTIDEYAAVIGHTVWLERRAFEIVGAWARDTSDPGLKLRFAARSAHHGFHARLLEPLVPDTRDHDPARLVRPADDAWAQRLDALAASGAGEGARDGHDQLRTWLRDSHAAALAAMTPVAEAPARRVLGLVVADHAADDAED
jgi:hypothetical protein